jgi:plastocyanin
MRNQRSQLAVALIVLATVICGCNREDGRNPPVAKNAGPGATTAAAVLTTGKGILRGVVKYSGPAPVLKPSQRECHPGGPLVNIPDESVLVGPKGELKNVIVFLKNPPGEGPVHESPVIDQKDCVYIPHVVAMQTGQSIKFTSNDPVLHNIHVISRQNGEFNQGIQKGGEVLFPVTSPDFFPVKCDVHPWMMCRVGVFDHPYFTVTKDDGAFEFKNLPPGTYTVGVYHEKLGQRTQDATVADDKPADITITIVKQQ